MRDGTPIVADARCDGAPTAGDGGVPVPVGGDGGARENPDLSAGSGRTGPHREGATPVDEGTERVPEDGAERVRENGAERARESGAEHVRKAETERARGDGTVHGRTDRRGDAGEPGDHDQRYVRYSTGDSVVLFDREQQRAWVPASDASDPEEIV